MSHPLLPDNIDVPLIPTDLNDPHWADLGHVLKYIWCTCPELSCFVPCSCDQTNRFFESGIEHLQYDCDELNGPSYVVLQDFGFNPSRQNSRTQSGTQVVNALIYTAEKNLSRNIGYAYTCKIERFFSNSVSTFGGFRYGGVTRGGESITKTNSKHWRYQQSFTFCASRARTFQDLPSIDVPVVLPCDHTANPTQATLDPGLLQPARPQRERARSR